MLQPKKQWPYSRALIWVTGATIWGTACANAPGLNGVSQGDGNDQVIVRQSLPQQNETADTAGESQDATAEIPKATGTPGSTPQPHPAVVNTKVTQFPLVLHHGLFASKSSNNFKDVKVNLEKNGFKVFETEVAMASGVELRAKQLGQQIDQILDSTGAEKVNLIAHSMGGLDARYVISSLGYENKVASLTTLATPHQGTVVADEASDGKGFDAKVNLDTIIGIFAAIKTKSVSAFSEVDVHTAVKNLSTEYVRNVFNPQNPDKPEVFYQSWGAHTQLLAKSLNEDTVNPTLLYSFKIETAREGDNDGLVATTSARWGEFKGILAADHFDIIGQGTMGAKSLFDHQKFFYGIAKGLADKGF